MNMCDRNILVFNETKELSGGRFRSYTDKICTRVYAGGIISDISCDKCNIDIHFNRQDTISSIRSFANIGCRVCALNFADAYNVGGMVKEGASTQEEDLCRCSNLYESLRDSICMTDYYNYNKSKASLMFTDRCIYSKDILVFRDSKDYCILNNPVVCDIISCPAPIFDYSDEYMEVIHHRMQVLLSVVASNDVDVLILGAWGCGAFGGDAKVLGRCFAEVLEEYPYFKQVVFSVKSLDSDVVDNFKLLKSGFKSYKG